MKVFRVLALGSALALAAGGLSAGPFDDGERLFRQNQPKEAVPLLEQAISEAGADERAWIYLAVSYQQLGRLDDAAAVLRRGVGSAQRFKHLFYFDLGNVFTLQGRNAFAEDAYGQAITANPGYAPAYLNRANSRLNLKNFDGAQADYRHYLELDIASPQRAAIEELLKRLGAAIAESERLQADAAAKLAADEAAKKALLDQVTSSLKAAADETTSLSAGSGSVQGYGDELKIED
ncbi:MAG TPA: tetratricopeptide repeat protein [Rectinemataceae bacterium]|nr:tetratricopeptide repeat protein [Rectinemataceae bacterium]